MSLNIALLGAAGRMGQALLESIGNEEDLVLSGALVRPGSVCVGEAASPGVAFTDQPVGALDNAGVAIDFTLPEALNGNLSACREAGVPLVIGTTGLGKAHLERLREVGRELPIVWSPNMSVGVNLCFRLAEIAATSLAADYDVEIVDEHHRHKRDVPSGTALRFGEIVAAARGEELADIAEHRAPGKDRPRHRGAIGFASVRAGAEVGRHKILFASEGEMVEIHHRAMHRGAFADGALRAARWLAGRPAGLYSMNDVLGL